MDRESQVTGLRIRGWYKDRVFGGYVIIAAEYSEEVSEEWLFSGPPPKGLYLTEVDESEPTEDDPAVLKRKWGGPMEAADIEQLRYDWDLDHEDSEPNLGMLTEFGHLPGDRFNLDGMQWNVGGWTPIIEVSVSIFDAEALNA